LWKILKSHCELSGIGMTSLPHFSWQSAEKYDIEKLDRVMRGLSDEFAPFTVHTSGLGLFTGSYPVLYLSLVKSEQLLILHKKIWFQIGPFAEKISQYYSPDFWVPHITIAYHDLDISKIICAVKTFLFTQLDFAIQINNMSVLFQDGDEMGYIFNRDGNIPE
jgi:2'-5' RNA ligase